MTRRERNTGTITKVGSRKFHLRYGYTTDGVRRQRKRVVEDVTKSEARVLLNRLIAEAKLETTTPGELTINRHIERWKSVWLPTLELSEQTRHHYARLLRQYVQPHIGQIKLSDFTDTKVREVQAALRGRGLSTTTIRMAHHALRIAMDSAVADGKLDGNPARNVKAPAVRRTQVDPPAPRIALALLTDVGRLPYGVAFRLCAFGGIRRGEAAALRWIDVDWKKGRILVSGTVIRIDGHGLKLSSPKTKRSRRWVSLDSQTMILLRNHQTDQNEFLLAAGGVVRNDGEMVFLSPFGGLLDPMNLTREWRAANKRAGTNCRLHSLRHLHATQLVAAGVPIHIVQQRLGHADVSTTLEVYAHALPGQDEAAAEVFAEIMNQGQ